MKKERVKRIHITEWPPKTAVEDVGTALGRFVFPNTAGLRPETIYVPNWKEKLDPKKITGAGFKFELLA
ncbi:MAG: hypothetical protein WC870_02760 [Candidatus Paceibacterota bacterium]